MNAGNVNPCECTSHCKLPLHFASCKLSIKTRASGRGCVLGRAVYIPIHKHTTSAGAPQHLTAGDVLWCGAVWCGWVWCVWRGVGFCGGGGVVCVHVCVSVCACMSVCSFARVRMFVCVGVLRCGIDWYVMA